MYFFPVQLSFGDRAHMESIEMKNVRTSKDKQTMVSLKNPLQRRLLESGVCGCFSAGSQLRRV